MYRKAFAMTGLILGSISLPATGATLVFDGTLFADQDGRGSTVDLISFAVTSASPVTIDIAAWENSDYNGGSFVDLNGDGDWTFFDSYIKLYRNDGTLTADDFLFENDDGSVPGQGGADGSPTDRDSYLSLNLNPGSYLLAIAPWHQGDGFDFSEVVAGVLTETSTLMSRVVGSGSVSDFADYRVTIDGSVAAPVPVPAAIWLLGSALFGLASVGRQRNR